MKIAVITVAGTSSRFNVNEEKKSLKAIYHKDNPLQTLLFRQCHQCQNMDKIIIVGGYMYNRLSEYINNILPKVIREKIILLYNERYSDYTSGYSLYLGLQAIFSLEQNENMEILFMEGDLAVDNKSLSAVIAGENDVITYNREVIDSRKSVVVYESVNGSYHYAFNDTHGFLKIDDSFVRVWNSGQIWKFTNLNYLKTASELYAEEAISGTNLEIIQRYFDMVSPNDVCVLPIDFWVNCNTRKEWSFVFDALNEVD